MVCLFPHCTLVLSALGTAQLEDREEHGYSLALLLGPSVREWLDNAGYMQLTVGLRQRASGRSS
jgi:hypothetical protein